MTPGYKGSQADQKRPGTPHTVPSLECSSHKLQQIVGIFLCYADVADSQLDETIPNAMLMVITELDIIKAPFPPLCSILIFEF